MCGRGGREDGKITEGKMTGRRGRPRIARIGADGHIPLHPRHHRPAGVFGWPGLSCILASIILAGIQASGRWPEEFDREGRTS